MRNLKGDVVLRESMEDVQRQWNHQPNQSILKCEYDEGDGSPGSLRVFKLDPALCIYVKESIEKIEEVESGQSVTYQVIGGNLRNMYDPYRVAFAFALVEGEEKAKCIDQWRVKSELLNPAKTPPEKARDAALGFLKSFKKLQLSY